MSTVRSHFRALRRAALASTVLVALASATANADERTYSFNFNQISLSDALRAYAKITGQQIIFTEDLVSGLTAPSLKGAYTSDDALAQLLSNTGLVVQRSPSGAIMVRRLAAAEVPQTAAQAPTSDKDLDQPAEGDRKADGDRKVERVVVTGTNIRGKHPKSSPLDVYTRKDIERSGATTTEQFIQKLPQNFGTRTQYASSAIGTGNQLNLGYVAGVDLRGLGIGTSLTLLNGRRLGLADLGRTADVSMIPASAIERVEVLTDGASAIYGSDAIGGVVNFILRKDFDGAETRITYGGVTNGNLHQGELNQTFGHAWGSGNALVSYSAYSASSLETTDRSYVAIGAGTLTPIDQRQNLLATFSQELGEGLSIGGDVLIGQRDIKTKTSSLQVGNPLNWSRATFHGDTDQFFADVALDYDISPNLHASLVGSYAETATDLNSTSVRFNRVPPAVTIFTPSSNYSGSDVTAMLDGRLFQLPSGDVRFSLGTGLLNEEYSGSGGLALDDVRGILGRSTTYAFGELYWPLVSAEQDVPLVNRLELNLAARYTRYDDRSDPKLDQRFGDGTDPKIGLLWAPIEALSFRGTYGTSFRAPSMIQLDEASSFAQLIENAIPIPTSGAAANVLIVGGRPVPELAPENATSYTIGFDFQPENSSFRLSGTYYNVSYQGRIALPPFTFDVFDRPELYPHSLYQPSSPAQIAELIQGAGILFDGTSISLSDPNAAQVLFALPNVWIADQRIVNLAQSEQDGIDLSVRDSLETNWGEIRFGANITYILAYRQQASSDSAVTTTVDRATQPIDLRGRAYFGVSRGGFDGTLSVNYVDDYSNNRTSTQGAVSIESWTTTDLSLSYEFDEEGPRLLSGVRLTLSAQNLFDEEPPFVAGGSLEALVNEVGFDPANANPLGRILVLGVTKRW